MSILFEKASIGAMEVKNRFIRSATWEELADKQGHTTPEWMEVYRKLAEGGVGTIITCFAYVNKCDWQDMPNMIAMYDDGFIPEFQKLTEMVHQYGAKIILQIGFGGDDNAVNTMSREELQEQITLHAEAARRAKEAGFDGVEFHCAHGVWQSRFLTPAYNHRTDEYGGSLENRARIIYELYDAVREAVGKEFQVWIKINCDDFTDQEGFTFEECKIVCKELERRGMDLIELSGSNELCREGENTCRKGIVKPEKEAYFGRQAAELARELSIPVASVGGIRSVAVMERLVQDGVGFVSMCRPFLSEPDLVNKLQAGAEKARCVSCNWCFDKVGKPCVFNRK